MFRELHLTGLWIEEPPEGKRNEEVCQGCGQRNPSSGGLRHKINSASSRKGQHEEK
jgi:hypothetical protein